MSKRGPRLPKSGESLGDRFPEVITFWNWEKNRTLTPYMVKPYSTTRVWWKCEYGHEWETEIRSRVQHHSGCPKCNAEKSTSFPEQAIHWCLTRDLPEETIESRKKILIPGTATALEADIYIASMNVAIEYDGHGYHALHGERELRKDRLFSELDITTYHVLESNRNHVQGNTIEYVYMRKRNESLNWAIEQLYDLLGIQAKQPIDVSSVEKLIYAQLRVRELVDSFATAHPNLLPEYLSDKNQGLDPRNVREFSHLKAWWKCSACGNEWEASFAKRANGQGCPKCSAQRNADLKKVPERGRSWGDVYPKYVYLWDTEKNEGVSPFDVKPSSNQLVWWKCPRCGSTWQGKPNAFRDKKGSGCKGCSATITNLRRYEKPLPDWAREFYPEDWFD